MKKESIHAGGVYFDGKQGLRRAVQVGISSSDSAAEANDQGCMSYETIFKPRAEPLWRQADQHVCTIASFAQWAKEEIAPDQVDAKVIELTAASVRVNSTAAALLNRLHHDQAGHPHAQKLTGGERRTSGKLAAQGLLLVVGGVTTSYARLSPIGESWIRQQAAAVAPKEPSSPPRRSRHP